MDLLDSRQAGAAAEPCTPAVVALAKLGRWAGRQFANALAPIGLKQRHLGTLLELRAGPLAQQAQFVALLRLVVERGGYDEDCADSPGACATENDEFALPPCPSSREGTAPG